MKSRVLIIGFGAFLGMAAFVSAAHSPSSPASAVTLSDLKLVGDFTNDHAAFTLSATATVAGERGRGTTLELLEGTVAVTELGSHAGWEVRAEPDRLTLTFPRTGKFPIRLKFEVPVHQSPEGAGGWRRVDFQVTPGPLQAVMLRGLPAETQFDFAGAARPQRAGEDFVSYLPASGAVNLAWKEARPEAEGKLFYSAQMLSQVTVSPGLMRQVGLFEGKIMQGELTTLKLALHGTGEVTRVQGDQVLAWNVQPQPGSAQRLLVVQFNQPQNDHFALQINLETPLGAFPQTADAVRLQPQGATRFAGYFRVVNEGAVRLEVAQASGLSQISPEQFPENDATRAALRVSGGQRFAYRFSSPDFALRIQADQIQPEVAVSQVTAYRLGDNELSIEAQLELDIREAPLRELTLRVPRGYALARLSAPGLADYFMRDAGENPNQAEAGADGASTRSGSELRLVYGAPVSGRQVIELRLERNQSLGETNWILPRLEVAQAKSVRGHVAAAADAGFRLSPERTQGLTEVATAFFPAKVPGIQAAFRLSDASWQAVLRVERLPQRIQADVFHLFSIGQGIAYGSSLINYSVSGAPISTFKVEIPEEYLNVEFTGKDLRNWQKTEGGYLVQLHTPVSGACTLLATYERPFNAQGATLAFNGARPADAESEQGHIVIISGYQFEKKPLEVSPGLLALEAGEVPPEYRLFFDAPILAAYRYTTRPFQLKLALSPLAQGDSLSQVVDRATLTTRVSKEGQVLTNVRYFVKNRGHPSFRLTLPAGAELWSASVNGTPAAPVMDGAANLIPLPQGADCGSVLTVDLQIAAKAADPKVVRVTAPMVGAPVLLEEWKLDPDAGQKLVYRRGSLVPTDGLPENSGFATVARAFTGDEGGRAALLLAAGLGLVAVAVGVWGWTIRSGAYRYSARHVAGLLLGAVAIFFALGALIQVGSILGDARAEIPRALGFLAPVQQPGTALEVELLNERENAWPSGVASSIVIAALGLVAWGRAWMAKGPKPRNGAVLLGWFLLAWAALRAPAGTDIFVAVAGLFLVAQVLVPALRRLLQAPRRPQSAPAGPAGASAAPALAAWLLVGVLGCGALGSARAEAGRNAAAGSPPLAESVTQEVRVEENFALATARIRWQAAKGERLPVLFSPAVLTRVDFPKGALKLEEQMPLQAGVGSDKQGGNIAPAAIEYLAAEKSGTFNITVQYQVQISKREAESGLVLPVGYGLINRLQITLVNLDVEVRSPQAVSVERVAAGSNTVAALVLTPAPSTWVGWKPRSRDLRHENPVFYADVSQLYVPAAGIIEGVHSVSIRPAQGELDHLVLVAPPGAAITDVTDPAAAAPNTGGHASGAVVSTWRFDPDTRQLRVTLNPPQSRPFTVLVRSQIPVGPLPFEKSAGLLAVEGAAGQIGLLGLATGNEVQLDHASAEGFSPINLEDFPGEVSAPLRAQIPGLTVRRAYRYSAAGTAEKSGLTFSLGASAVEPDVRVEAQNTLSLGEDRSLLASDLDVAITRAGIFKLSFVMPAGFDVESISGAALSHWTESRSEEGRVITLHLTGKVEGEQKFELSLAGPGVKSARGWVAPVLAVREASKQRGTLLLAPEQGLRLQVTGREGVTQLDPQKSGIRQPGVLAFRVLQTPWKLTLDVEQVEPWIQVNSLQHALVSEAQIKVVANLQYQIENTGLKALRVLVPTNAENVRFEGDQVALAVPGAVTNRSQVWEVKLHRRVIGPYFLKATYQTRIADGSAQTSLRSVQAAEVNLQRGFVAVQSEGRLQVRAGAAPAALQPAEWQSIPRALERDLPALAANFTYRLVEPDFELPLGLERHEAAKLLPARIEHVAFHSVISDAGVMLTHATLDLAPGDLRQLNFVLPSGANFWFAFVNHNGVWPWREGDRILIPLEPSPCQGGTMPVELFYSCQAGAASARALDLSLAAPSFGLPLEDLTWRVALADKWRLKHWSGALELQQDEVTPQSASLDLETYLKNESALQQERTREAEGLVASANSALAQGDPQQARRAFQAAYGLSAGDAAFNEDARVQLHNVKLQQALVGLNVRQAAIGSTGGGVDARLRDLRARAEISYTQQDAKDIIERNDAEDNAAFLRLAERIIQQQDAAVSSVAAIRATVPEEGRVLTFKRAVVVEPWADLKIHVEAAAVQSASWMARAAVLGVVVLMFLGFGWAGTALKRGFRSEAAHPAA